MSPSRAALAFVATCLMATGTLAAARPHLNSGACLSCHAKQLAVLPAQPCVSCHLGSMDFLARHDRPAQESPLWVIGATGGASLAVLALLGIFGARRWVPAVGVLTLAALGSPGAGEPLQAPVPGALLAAEGFACDLSPRVSPEGSAAFFARRGPDTNGDGRVDMRDGLALFLIRRGWDAPRRLTPYTLDAQAGMASWAHDGTRLVLPVPSGLAVFGAEGQRLARLKLVEGDALSPTFSAGGDRIAFVMGSGIGLWDLATGRWSWALEPLEDGTFPRLAGWSPWGEDPLFTRGSDYTLLERNQEGRRILPTEVPLEAAVAGTARTLTPGGRETLRRFKAQPIPGGVFFLAQHPGGKPGLYLFDGAAEQRWSGDGESVFGFEALSDTECWAWVSVEEGRARLVRYTGPGRGQAAAGASMKSNLLVLAVQGPGAAWFSGALSGGARRGLFQSGTEVRTDLERLDADVFGVCTAGGTTAAVTVPEDTDGDGERTPWDDGRLWIAWGTP